MSLLASILTRPLHMPQTRELLSVDRLREDLPRIQCVRIDNVIRYWAEHRDDHVVDTAPSLMPPFDHLWMEGTRPTRIFASGNWKSLDEMPHRWGALAIKGDRTRVGWPLMLQFFGDFAGERSCLSLGSVAFVLDDAGRVVPNVMGDGKSHMYAMPTAFQRDAASAESYSEFLNILLQPPQLAIGFMHCKNVKRREAMLPRAERRRAEREGVPTLKFYELAIDPMAASSGDRAETTRESSGVSLHICRGHFATYDEKPLFGRYRGTFWVPAHVRGRADVGIVEKTYAVSAPRGAA